MKQHIIFVSIILFFTLMGMAGGAYAEMYEATGTSTMEKKSLTNALVAAHFKCNKKRLWADLNTLAIVETSKSSYKIAGGRKAITEYHTTVIFGCGVDYKKSVEEVL
jgi:hypothetical protein